METYEIYFDCGRVLNIYNEDTQKWIWNVKLSKDGRVYMIKRDISAKERSRVIDFAYREVTALLEGSLSGIESMSDYELGSRRVERIS